MPRSARHLVRGGHGGGGIGTRAAALAQRAAERLLIAHMRTEEAEGAARAVGFARSGEAWRPRDVRREAEELFRFAPGAA